MKIILIMAILISMVVGFIIFVDTCGLISLYGKPIKEADLDKFMAKNLGKYVINQFSDGRMLVDHRGDYLLKSLPYIVRNKGISLFSWKVEDIGVIYRWSKWSKVLETKRAKLWSESQGSKGIEQYF